MCFREIDLTDIERDETVIVRLPLGRLMEVEWLDSDADALRIVGFESNNQYLADEEYRLAGFQPMLRCFYEHISTKVNRTQDIVGQSDDGRSTQPPNGVFITAG